jgi:hypothetical protein
VDCLLFRRSWASCSVLAVFLKYSIKLLYKVLLEEEAAEVQTPLPNKIAEYQEVIAANYPTLAGKWYIIDG